MPPHDPPIVYSTTIAPAHTRSLLTTAQILSEALATKAAGDRHTGGPVYGRYDGTLSIGLAFASESVTRPDSPDGGTDVLGRIPFLAAGDGPLGLLHALRPGITLTGY